MNRLRQLWSNINSSLWFVPTLMVLVAMLLAYFLVRIDDSISHNWISNYPLLFGTGADGARGMLSSIASSMITVAGLIFSLTLSTLAQVSSQYTSRLLRNFMRDRANQVVMGFFVGIFVYCLMVLRTIRGGDEGKFVPSLAVAFGLLLALVSIGMLVFFIHHIASSVQAANILSSVSEDTLNTFRKIFPQHLADPAHQVPTADPAMLAGLRWVGIPARATGYVQSIDEETLLDFARETDTAVRMERAIGSFVSEGSPLVSVAYYGAAADMSLQEQTDRLNRAYNIGHQRTLDQDAGFGFRQIVDIALKAFSPGVNDTTTGIMCIDYLGGLLAHLADQNLGDPYRAEERRIRVVAIRPDFASFAGTAFDQIRTDGAENLAVHLRLLTALTTVAHRTQDPARRAVLRHHAAMTKKLAEENLTAPYDLDQVRARYSVLTDALEE